MMIYGRVGAESIDPDREKATTGVFHPQLTPGAVTEAVLVVFPGALGDFICFLPTLYELRVRYREDAVVVVVQASLLPLAVRPGLGDQGVALESAAFAQLFVRGSDQTFPVPGISIGDVYSWFGSADPVVRENLTKLAGGRVLCERFSLPPEHGGHAAHWFLRTVGLGPTRASMGTQISLQESERDRADEFWQHHGLADKSVLAVHRGAGNQPKRWTRGGYEVVTHWWRERGGGVLEIAGPGDLDEPLATAHAVARGLPLSQVAALLARADLYLGSDTGISHLAGAVGARGVVVFGPTRLRVWRPLGGRLVCLKSLRPSSGDRPVSLSAVATSRVIRALDMVAMPRTQP